MARLRHWLLAAAALAALVPLATQAQDVPPGADGLGIDTIDTANSGAPHSLVDGVEVGQPLGSPVHELQSLGADSPGENVANDLDSLQGNELPQMDSLLPQPEPLVLPGH